MANKLSEKCPSCQSYSWCGRACANEPEDERGKREATEAILMSSKVQLVMSPALIAAAKDRGVSDDAMANVVEQKPIPSDGTGSTYLYRDPDRRRNYMKDYMRKRRAKG